MKTTVIFLFTCVLLIPSLVYADVAQFVFTTEPQTVLPNTLSGSITIQSQNESGLQEAAIETTDLTFTSTSPTGQFLSSTGKAISKTMAKGTANRTFYYSDSTLGSYILTVTATGRTSKKSFSTTQQITIASTLPSKPTPKAQTKKPTLSVGSPTSSSVGAKVSKPTSIESAPRLESVGGTASSTHVATVYEAAVQTNIFDSIFDWPGKFWYWLTNIF